MKSGALYGTGTIDGLPVVLAAIDFGFIGGSMSGAVGEAITRAAELALETRTPLLVISASGGARMQEGCVSLMQMAKTSQAVARMAEEGVLFISLLTDPTYGGVSASYATLGDVLISEPGAHIGFAGPSVIEQTIHQQLPDGFQTAEFLLEHGMLDVVEPRENLRRTIRNLLGLHAAAEAARGDDGEQRDQRLPSADGAAPGDRSRAAAGPGPVGDRAARPAHRPARACSIWSASRSTSSTSCDGDRTVPRGPGDHRRPGTARAS